jgi:hypothetical protein
MQDEKKVDTMTAEVAEYLPTLRERAIALQAELEREREVVADIEACDQDELQDWKNAAEDTTYVLHRCLSPLTNGLREGMNKRTY